MPEGKDPAGDGIVLGFDFGLRRIGVALGNGVTRSASGLKVVHRVGTHATGPRGKSPGKSPGKTPGKPPGRTRGGDHWAELAALIAHWQPRQLVVGVARHPDGAAHEMTERCERFARQLEGRFGLPVARVDERYSSAVLDPQAATDDQAAAVILQQWFDERADAGAGIRC